MNALCLTLLVSVLALGTAHAAGDELPVETIVVTGKRPAFLASGETMLVVTVTARARIMPDVVTVPPEVSLVLVRPEDSLVIEPPRADLAIVPPKFEQPQLSIAPPRIVLALAEGAETQG
jgi:hypothetical protein